MSESANVLSRVGLEMRTPLNLVVGFSHLLLHTSSKSLNNNQLEYLNEIFEAGKCLEGMLDTFSAIDSLQYDLEHLDVHGFQASRVVSQCISELAYELERKSVSVESNLDTDVAMLVDDVLFQRVFRTLLFASMEDSVSCERVVVDLFEEQGRVVVSVVIHRGPDADISPKEREAADRDAGIWTINAELGLPLARKYMDAMHGEMETLENGFRLSLPRADAEAGENEGWKNSNLDPLLLIIDDNASIRKLFSGYLSMIGGWRWIEAADGETGLELAKQEKPAVVLMDYHLPDVNGHALLAQFRQAEALQHTPVIAISGRFVEQSSPGGEFEFDQCVVKPVSMSHLRNMLDLYVVR